MNWLLVLIIINLGVALVSKGENDQQYLKWAEKQVETALKQGSPIPDGSGIFVVPTPKVAEDIHVAVASAIFGSKQIEGERPFHVIRVEDYWVVYGSLPEGRMGGTAITVIRASNGQILRLVHEM